MHVLVSVRTHKNSQSRLKNKLKNILLTAYVRISAAAAEEKQQGTLL